MFCLGCGAETPPRAVKCPVCGRDLGGTAGEVSYAISPTASGNALPMPPAAALYKPPALASATSAPASPSITRGDLDGMGIPRDAHGRAVLVTIIAMAVDLLAPWVVTNQTHHAAAAIGAPALVALPILGAALLPLVSPALRKTPTYAALPMIIGGLCVGAAGAFWALLTYLSYDYSIASALLPPSPTFVIGPDVGVYLFMLGGAVLIFTGYPVFLSAAAGVSPGSAAPMTATPAPTLAAPVTIPLPPPPAMPPYLQAQIGATSQPAPTFGATSDPYGRPSLPLASYTPPPAPAISDGTGGVSLPGGDSTERGHEDDASATAQNGALHIPLPGSVEWNKAPEQPGYVRPSLGGGWQRGGRVRR